MGRLINIKRPNDPLREAIQDAEAHTKEKLKSRLNPDEREKLPDAKGSVKLLLDVAKRIQPEGLMHLASIAVHVYAHPLDPTKAQLIFQSSNLSALPENLALLAVQDMGRHVMARYGHTPPARVGEKPNQKGDI